jgi:CBS domain-containing protein
MSVNVVTTPASASVPTAARVLVEQGSTSMPVTDDDALVGIVSESDPLRGWGAASPTLGHRFAIP